MAGLIAALVARRLAKAGDVGPTDKSSRSIAAMKYATLHTHRAHSASFPMNAVVEFRIAVSCQNELQR